MGSPSIRRSVEEAVEREANLNAAVAASLQGNHDADWLEAQHYDSDEYYLIAEFGDEAAVNGESLVPPRMYEVLALDRAPHAELWTEAGRGEINAVALLRSWLEQSEYELTEWGGQIPTEEMEIDVEMVARHIAEELDVRYGQVEKAARKVYSEPLAAVAVSGHTELWAMLLTEDKRAYRELEA